jgi:uncharacterized membrane protein YkoI
MKRTSLILLTAGAVTAAAITGTALASGSQGAVPARNASSLVATATPTVAATSAVTAGPTATGSAPVSHERAGEIALADVGGGRLIEIEQEVEHGRTAWSVKILKDGTRQKVYVDRATGRIMRTEQTPAGDDHGSHHSGTDDRGTDDRGGDTHGRDHH